MVRNSARQKQSYKKNDFPDIGNSFGLISKQRRVLIFLYPHVTRKPLSIELKTEKDFDLHRLGVKRQTGKINCYFDETSTFLQRQYQDRACSSKLQSILETSSFSNITSKTFFNYSQKQVLKPWQLIYKITFL